LKHEQSAVTAGAFQQSAKNPPHSTLSDGELQRRLSLAINSELRADVTILRRDPNEFSTTFPTEVVTCELDGLRVVRLFCKHFHFGSGHAHRENISSVYEIDIYRHFLRHSRSSLPRFFGSWIDADTGEALLVLEFLENATRLTRSPDHIGSLFKAATWLGEFHSYSIAAANRPELSFVNRVNLHSYQARCAELVPHFGFDGELHDTMSLLNDRFDRVLDVALEAPLAVTHGDFYPQNVLVSRGEIYPVDWEAASMTIAEMDLAMLLEGSWPADLVETCIRNYLASRQSGDEDAIRRRLDAARVLLNVYWIGLYPRIEIHGEGTKRLPWRFNYLRDAARRLGILP
jgi:thiamine kinase-like enzyme